MVDVQQGIGSRWRPASGEMELIKRKTARMLEELNDIEAGESGFTGTVQAEFSSSQTRALTQYNLSAWRDEASAATWSRSNAEHAEIVSQYKEGAKPAMRTFSSVLMNLGPLGKGIRRHQRCLSCEQLNYNIEPGLTVCANCGVPLENQYGFDRTSATLPWF